MDNCIKTLLRSRRIAPGYLLISNVFFHFSSIGMLVAFSSIMLLLDVISVDAYPVFCFLRP